MNTIYGISLGLDIPQLVCNIDEHGVVVANGVDCDKPNIFGKYQNDPANLIVANKLILLMINAFVDFFIQYHNTGGGNNKSTSNLRFEKNNILFYRAIRIDPNAVV